MEESMLFFVHLFIGRSPGMEVIDNINKSLDVLNDSELTTFMYIVNQVINDQALTKSNEDIAKDREKSISTIEKHLGKLNKLGFIDRKSIKQRNPIFLNWETISRKITIPSSVLDPKLMKIIRMQRINETLALVNTSEAMAHAIKKMRKSRTK